MFGLVPFDKRNRGLIAGNPGGDMDLFFDNFVSPYYFGGGRQMKVDIRETDKEYFLDADLPGIKKEQVKLEVDNDQLVISVVEDEKTETKEEGYICRERRFGTIARSFPLTNIDAEKISAKLENGILSVTLPKKVPAEPKARRIDIE